MSRNINIGKDTSMLPRLPDGDDLWTVYHDAQDRQIVGSFYREGVNNYAPFFNIPIRYSNRNFWSMPLIKYENEYFKFQSDVKCKMCKNMMKIILRFIDPNQSYCFDTERSNERVCFTITINDLNIMHRYCKEHVMTNDDNIVFIVQELKMSLSQWWDIMVIKKWIIILAIFIFMIIVYMTIVLNMIMNIIFTASFWTHLIILVITLLTCMGSLIVLFVFLKRNTYLNGYFGTRRALRLGLRKRF